MHVSTIYKMVTTNQYIMKFSLIITATATNTSHTSRVDLTTTPPPRDGSKFIKVKYNIALRRYTVTHFCNVYMCLEEIVFFSCTYITLLQGCNKSKMFWDKKIRPSSSEKSQRLYFK